MFAQLREWSVSRLPKGRVARGIIALASGTAIAQFITICAMPIITRMYTPAQVGVISLFTAFYAFWSTLLSMRYESALLVAREDAESHIVYRIGAISVAILSMFAFFVLWLMRDFQVLGFEVMPWWSDLIAVPIFVGTGHFAMFRAWSLRGGMVKPVTHSTIMRALAKVLTRLVLGAFGGGVLALFIAEVVSAWSSAAALVRAVRARFLDSQPASIQGREMWVVARRYAKFPLYELPSVVLDAAALSLPVPMIASVYGVAASGWFGLARTLVAIPNTQIGAAVADVFQMELANAVRAQDHARARKLFYQLLKKLALFGLLPMAAIMVFAPWLAGMVLGKAWSEVGMLSACIAPWLYASLVVGSLSRLASVLEAQRSKLVYDVVAIGLMLAAYSIAKHQSFGMMMMVVSFTVANFIAYMIYLAVLLRIVWTRL